MRASKGSGGRDGEREKRERETIQCKEIIREVRLGRIKKSQGQILKRDKYARRQRKGERLQRTRSTVEL